MIDDAAHLVNQLSFWTIMIVFG